MLYKSTSCCAVVSGSSSEMTPVLWCGSVVYRKGRGNPHIPAGTAGDWVREGHVHPAGRAPRLCFVGAFARHLSAIDPLTEVPSQELYPYRSTRARPY